MPSKPNDESVALLMEALRSLDSRAATSLWQRYFPKLRRVARQKLGPQNAGPFDSEDVALSAFDGFCRAVQEGRYPELNDRESLWALLVQITRQKAKDYRAREMAQKRTNPREEAVLDSLAGNVAPPDIEMIMAEECERLLGCLPDENLVKVALLKLEGWTNDEIAVELNYTRRTIQRMLSVVRGVWGTSADEDVRPNA